MPGSLSPTQFERNWAMLAHLTALLTLVVGLSTGGLGAVAALLVPLGMYVYFRERSPYVAFHALQATAFQSFTGIAFVLMAALGSVVIAGAWVITVALSFVLVGLLLVPVSLVVTIVLAAGLLALPLAALVYAVRGAYLTYQGLPFDYPWVGALARRTMEAPVVSPVSSL